MDSYSVLQAARARMTKNLKSFRVGNIWFSLRKDDTTGTGCNIYFEKGNVWRKGSTKSHLIYEKGVDMTPIMDAVIVWFLYYDEALWMMNE